MPVLANLANLAWMAAARAEHARFRRALTDPAAAQRAMLARFLADNAGCDYGRRFGFGKLHGPEDYRRAVPAVSYDDLRPDVARVADRAEPNILGTAPVRRFETTGGSTGATTDGGRKLIPYPDPLRAGFSRAVGAWMFDLLRHTPGMVGGPQHWFITPAGRGRGERTPGGLPVGFDTDADYLGPLERALATRLFPVPGAVAGLTDLDAAFYVTLRFMFQTPGLRFISAWHPSLLVILWQRARGWASSLIDDLSRGTLTLPNGEITAAPALRRGLRAMPERARRLRERKAALTPADVWPELRLLSCWTDAAAAVSVPELRATFPGVPIQGKGLLATEGVVTIPLRECEDVGCPIALRSGFFEFLEDDARPDRARAAHELETGGEYTVLLTNGGGLWRYRLGDRVRVTGRVERTPLLRFLGKTDGVSDLRGEKLSPAAVGQALTRWLPADDVRFALLAPVTDAEPPGYALFLEMDDERLPPGLEQHLDDALAANPHYAFCRRAGQLGHVRVFRVRRGGQETFLARSRGEGQRPGDVKPTALSRLDGWEQWFEGAFQGL